MFNIRNTHVTPARKRVFEVSKCAVRVTTKMSRRSIVCCFRSAKLLQWRKSRKGALKKCIENWISQTIKVNSLEKSLIGVGEYHCQAEEREINPIKGTLGITFCQHWISHRFRHFPSTPWKHKNKFSKSPATCHFYAFHGLTFIAQRERRTFVSVIANESKHYATFLQFLFSLIPFSWASKCVRLTSGKNRFRSFYDFHFKKATIWLSSTPSI